MARENVNTANLFGWCVLSAFVLYGVGSSLQDRPIGLALVLCNSVAVVIAGWAGSTALGDAAPDALQIGYIYWAARAAEAALLALGALCIAFGAASLSEPLYLAAMTVLGVASVPFWWAVLNARMVPAWLCVWAMVAYALFASGCVAELITGRAVAIMTTPPAGIFELVVSIFLLVFGWQKESSRRDPLLRQENGQAT